ncbi:MAG: DUF5615 family PIN-like protein [Thermomicrobiales bacterium]
MGTPPLPPLLIDECLPQSIADFFQARGYSVLVVGQALPAGAPDVSVVAAALDRGAIVVTHDSDFRNMRASVTGTGGRLQRADRIYFKKCSHAQALARLAQLIDVIETEYRIAKATNSKFFIQITANLYTVFR